MNKAQLKIIKEEGVEFWNRNLQRSNVKTIFRDGKIFYNPNSTQIDLHKADLSGMDLRGIDFYKANLSQANFNGSNISGAILRNAYLHGADLSNCIAKETDFYESDLSLSILTSGNFEKSTFSFSNMWQVKAGHAIFSAAIMNKTDLSYSYLFKTLFINAKLKASDLSYADLTLSNLSCADISYANLNKAELHQTDLENSNLMYASLIGTLIHNVRIDGSKVYGVSVWDVDPIKLSQNNLIISSNNEVSITVDDIELSQFIYLLLNRKKLRNVISNLTSKSVLILGRFTPERKIVLETLANQLRENNLLPVIFDFEKVESRDFTETIRILAGLSLFIIADITNPRSSPLELQAIIPDYKVPCITIIKKGEYPFSMFQDLHNSYNWVLSPLIYDDLSKIEKGFKTAILERAWKAKMRIDKEKNKAMELLSFDQFIESEE